MRVANTIALGIMLLSIVLLQACGRKGPLYLQQVPPAPVAVVPETVTPASAVSPQPAPSPAASSSPTPHSSPTSSPTEPAKQP